MAKGQLKRWVRGLRRSGDFPLRLPHFELAEAGIRAPDGSVTPLQPSTRKALDLCDGTRKLSQICRATGVARSTLLCHHDAGHLILWHTPPAPLPTPQPISHIILSPHPDDAPLSLGGFLLTHPNTLILTLFGQSTWWRFPDAAAHRDEILSLRNKEERLMAQLCGAVLQIEPLPEATQRGHTLETVFTASPTVCDDSASAAIRTLVRQVLSLHPQAHWYLPLGIGNHLDHRIARDAALAELPQSQTTFYEDLPYAAQGAKATADLAGTSLVSRLLPCPIERKLELLRIYWTQFTWSRIQLIGQYARQVGDGRAAERLWQPNSPPMDAH
jgi:LmbE family N-acetylglucosaminyl deacetylase